MMKSLFLIALVMCTVYSAPEDCVKEKCPKEYNGCVAQVFGCAAVGLKCKNKCGDADDACMKACAYDSGNQKFIDLYECGKLNCPASMPHSTTCDVDTCTQTFTQVCLGQLNIQTITCAINFFDVHPECECIKEL